MLPRPTSVAIFVLVFKVECFNKSSVPFFDGHWGYIRIYKAHGRSAWKMALAHSKFRTYISQHDTGKMYTLFYSPTSNPRCLRSCRYRGRI